MPEYLAPGVYVEEIPSGNKPIQAASTSTAAMVGMTARGPVNRPTLVTSRGAYARLFGGTLNPLVFQEGRDSLPYAAEGFFTNGGARLYVVRVVGPAAAESELRLVAQDTGVDADTVLASTASSGQATLLMSDPGDLAPDGTILIANGSASEFVTIDDTAFEARPVLGGGLSNEFPTDSIVTVQTPTDLTVTLAEALEDGATEIVLNDASAIAADDVLLLEDASGMSADHELITVAAVDAATNTVTLVAGLRWAHDASATLFSLADGPTAPTLDAAVGPSGAPVFLDLDDPAGVDDGDVVRLEATAGTVELAVVTGVPQLVTLTEPLANNHAPGVAVMPAVEVLSVHARWPGVWGDSLRVTAFPASLVETETTSVMPADATSVAVSTAFGLYPGSVVVFAGAPPPRSSMSTPMPGS